MIDKIKEKIFAKKQIIFSIFLTGFLCTFLFGYVTLISNKGNIRESLCTYIAVLCCIMVLLTIFLCVIKKKVIFMCIVIVLIASLYYLKLPVGSGPDEANHFFRAFEISCGDLLSKHVGENKVGGNILPMALADFANKEAVLDWEQLSEIEFPTMSLYAPISYFPQAIAIKIARMVTDNVYTIFMAGRMGAMIVNLILICWALFKLPIARELLFLIILFPMNMQEMVVMSSDGWTMAMVSAFLAYILNLKYKDKINKRQMVVLLFMGLSIALSKIVYIVICFAIFMIPKEIFKSKKMAMRFKFGFILTVILANVLWLCVSYGYMTEFTPGVNSTEQIKYVLQNIPEFYLISIRTIFTNGASWIQSMFGASLGALNIPVNWSVWIVYLILIVAIIARYKLQYELKLADNIICLLIFLSGSALIFASLYVQWTAYQNPIIDGIQGRYFIPLLIFLFLPLVSFNNEKSNVIIREEKQDKENKINICEMMIPVFLNCIALVDIFNFALQNV